MGNSNSKVGKAMGSRRSKAGRTMRPTMIITIPAVAMEGDITAGIIPPPVGPMRLGSSRVQSLVRRWRRPHSGPRPRRVRRWSRAVWPT